MELHDYSQFHHVFDRGLRNPYDQDLIREIDAFRKKSAGVLFIDRVLKALGVTKTNRTYPPKGDNGLRDLHKAICDSKASDHHKVSVLFYLLLDYDDLQTRSNVADGFVTRQSVPKKFQLFMRGLWNMDRQRFRIALEHLAHPSLLPDYADDIVTVLVENAENSDYSLVLAYYYTVQPVLRTAHALELLFGAVARTSVTEALYFSRTHPDYTRQQLFHQLVAAVLAGTGSEDASKRATELVGLPLDGDEEAWFDDFLTAGEGKKLKKARDTVLMRKVITGRHGGSVGDESLDGQWGVVLDGLKSGMGGRA